MEIYNINKETIKWENVEKFPIFKKLMKINFKNQNVFYSTKNFTEDVLNLKIFELTKMIFAYAALLCNTGMTNKISKDEYGKKSINNTSIESAKIAKQFLEKNLDTIPEVKEAIVRVIRYHQNLMTIFKMADVDQAMLKLINNLRIISIDELIAFEKLYIKHFGDKNKIDYQYSVLENLRNLYYSCYAFKAGELVKITKIGVAKDSPYRENNHPNAINTGYETVGVIIRPITVGMTALIDNFRTSTVTKIVSKCEFETLNSIYKLEPLNFFNNEN
ncbi:MAG: hypothetical protein KBT03_11260 [Bacteroidales bacterium]|nr:hypothetical protein [Candidatus Scybalousia scybalohippi]